MIEAFFDGMLLVFQWPAIGFLFLGVAIGICLGVIPGLGATIGLVLLLPFTYGMDPVSAFAMLLGMWAVTATSDTIASVLLGIPGTASSQAIVLDGHPLAKKGEAGRAFGASFTVSMIGGLVGAMAMALALPVIRPFILSFTSPETFMVGVLALSLVGTLSSGSMLKGLAIAAIGLLIASVGYAPAVSIPRYFFNTDYLLDGLPLLPVVLGLFGIGELLDLAVRNTSISRIASGQVTGGGILTGVRDALRHWWLAIRCSVIGVYVGVLPGLGSSVVDWIAYGHTVQSAKDKSQFGKGDIRGVIGPDAANNANLGGALIPTIALGIPGGLGMAILLGALVLQGLKPGPEMLTTHLDITFSMVWSIIIANFTAAVMLMFIARYVARIAFVPGHVIVPAVILFLFMGAWLGSANMGDWIACLAFGVLGVTMKRGGWPRPPLILALVLGNLMENSFLLSVRVHQGFGWLGRPIVLVILLLIVGTVATTAWSTYKSRQKARAEAASATTDDAVDEEIQAEDGRGGNPLVSFALGSVLLAVFAGAALLTQQWPATVARFPLYASIAGFIFTAARMVFEVRAVRGLLARKQGLAGAARAMSQETLLPQTVRFIFYLIAMIVLAWLVGQKIAIPLYIAAYLLRWGNYGWKIALPGAIAGWAVLVFFYDRVMNLLWYQPVLDEVIRSILPAGFPVWLVL